MTPLAAALFFGALVLALQARKDRRAMVPLATDAAGALVALADVANLACAEADLLAVACDALAIAADTIAPEHGPAIAALDERVSDILAGSGPSAPHANPALATIMAAAAPFRERYPPSTGSLILAADCRGQAAAAALRISAALTTAPAAAATPDPPASDQAPLPGWDAFLDALNRPAADDTDDDAPGRDPA